MAEAGFEC